MVTYVGQAAVDATHSVLDVAGPEAVRERAIQLHQIDPAVLEPALGGTLLGHDQPDDLLAQIRCPVHLVAAQFALGGAMDAPDVQQAVAQMPHCTHTVIENSGHDIHLDQPETFARELKRFLSKLK
jgi:pimeloyl-ACP methyl ester carboxylesterase